MKLRFDIEQNTDEWLALKVGMFSASTAADLLMDKSAVGYKKLIDKIIEERITGQPSESKSFSGNAFTDRGHEFEPIARNDFELKNLTEVKTIGVIELDEWTLCSPDGLIDDDGLWQAKCPIFNTQREYLRKMKVPGNYYKQMQFELFVSGRKYNIFYSYHPSLPPVEIKVERDEVMIAQIKQRLSEAKAEVLAEIKHLESINK